MSNQEVAVARIDALIEDYLGARQRSASVYLDGCAALTPHRVGMIGVVAANDSTFHRPLPAQLASPAQKASVFFRSCAKNCAKSARFLLNSANFAPVNKRQRAALAACFFGFFSLFPSDTHSANLSTTP
ncbi:hypothetical protein [Burkholderia sp. JKS000303]|uniref:hypothetical protein n=1 Tax=Burkholderia sp. JKS000303 TaxID=1938747 RepID=UPI00117C9810|nr:hypothetical protein [Burkholderia sp. JKS000303]